MSFNLRESIKVDLQSNPTEYLGPLECSPINIRFFTPFACPLAEPNSEVSIGSRMTFRTQFGTFIKFATLVTSIIMEKWIRLRKLARYRGVASCATPRISVQDTIKGTGCVDANKISETPALLL